MTSSHSFEARRKIFRVSKKIVSSIEFQLMSALTNIFFLDKIEQQSSLFETLHHSRVDTTDTYSIDFHMKFFITHK